MTLVSKIMLGFVTIAALVFMWFAARTLATHDAWGSLLVRANQQEGQLEKTIDEIEHGKSNRNDPTAPLEDRGIRNLRAQLSDLTNNRGRVWRNTKLTGGDLDKGIVVSVEEPAPHGIEKNNLLWVFGSKPAGEQGLFIGEFVVVDAPAGGKQVTLAPIYKAMPSRVSDQERLAAKLNTIAGDETLSLYEVAPQDLHQYFLPLTEEELTKMIPPESLPEYLRDGKEAEADDPAERKFTMKQGDGSTKDVYRRFLRDYPTLFIGYDVIRTELIDEIGGYKADIPLLETVVKQLNDEKAEREAELKTLQEGNATLKGELSAVETHQNEVQTQLDETNQKIEDALKANAELSAKLKQLYAKAAAKAGEGGGPAVEAPAAPAPEEKTTQIVPEAPAIIR